MDLQAVLQWLGVLEQVSARGQAVYDQIKAVLATNGVEADTAALDAAIADAARRRALAEREATTATAAQLGVTTGSIGD